MHPRDTANQYTSIAEAWNTRTFRSKYGLPYLERAIALVKGTSRHALDVGCGGGRLSVHLAASGFIVTALDSSEGMIAQARTNLPQARHHCADITEWQSNERYDLVLAWDSTFHLPKGSQVPVLRKLCQLLRPNGVLLFTAGGVDSERTSSRDGFTFYYSSVAAHVLLKTLDEEGCRSVLLERDQDPEDHVAIIALRSDA